jgi:hypothetical protein
MVAPVTRSLPSLRNLFLEKPQRVGHPVLFQLSMAGSIKAKTLKDRVLRQNNSLHAFEHAFLI